MKLREYQQRAIDDLYKWFENGNTGNPCLVLPTGAGKSHIIAALCRDALQKWPETRVLMVTHVKELIEQNAEKMRQYWPNAPMGIYSASLGSKALTEPITFAGIQSIRNKADSLGHIDLIIIDECHLVSHKDEGGYRTLIKSLTAFNPNLRVIGLTATPFRLGHGYITDKPAIFDDLIEPVGIQELVFKGFLSTLRSKITQLKLSTEGVHTRGGEYVESELQAVIDTSLNNEQIVSESIKLAGNRKAWLFFCVGVSHAENIRDLLNARGIAAECVTGKTSKKERERIIDDFKNGKLRALTNANVLTTGFDYPDIDFIGLLRPTKSPGLYMQMAGRGLRLKSHTDHCLVLDFAGCVQAHGPITAVRPVKKKGNGGEAPVKVCEKCHEICALSARECPACGHLFPKPEEKDLRLRDNDIMGANGKTLEVTSWEWRKHTSRASGKEMIKCTYYGALSDSPVTEYFPIYHGGFAESKAIHLLRNIIISAGINIGTIDFSSSLDSAINELNKGTPPREIEYNVDGKFFRVIDRSWNCAT